MASSAVSNKLVNFILFQLVWVGFVIGAAKGFIWLGGSVLAIMLVWQLWPGRRHHNDGKMIAASIIIGFMISTIWSFTGLISYKYHWPLEYIAPWWIIALWVSFGATINHSLKWLHNNKFIGVLCGAIGGPLSYAAAERIGAVEIIQPWLTYSLLSIAWCLAVLILLNTDKLISQYNKGWMIDVGH